MRDITRRLGRLEAVTDELVTKIGPPAEPVTAEDVEAFYRFRDQAAAEAEADPVVQARTDHEALADFERFRRRMRQWLPSK